MPKSITFYLADQNPHRDRSLGITTITNTLISGLAKMPEFSLSQVVSSSSFAVEEAQVVKYILPWRTDTSQVQRLLTDHLHPLYLHNLNTDLWFYPKGYLPCFSKPGAPVVSMVHDTIIQHYADYYPKARSAAAIQYWLWVLKESLRKSDYVFTVSEHAQNQIINFCERYKISLPHIFVTYEASGFEDLTPALPSMKSDYILHLASEHPHKCTLQLLKLWQQLQEQKKDLPALHLVGALSTEAAALADTLIHVHIKDRLCQDAFVDEIKQARALLFPSEVEGFGLPAIEAYFLHTPVCFAEGTAVAEILDLSTAVGSFKLHEAESFARALDDVLQLSPQAIAQTRLHLLERYSQKRYLANVSAILSSI